ncbi:CPBP family intramembrane glutamic endopeptidase [Atopobacter phocae]|uniref:CPBP family intramembrane glutamic endopeptidase n=1 Tax=Atopobacter phocae TaxID=136492 RepID=UPI00046E5340|nr:type II CAAX endopeptidase family protein [Atopobacter phocae]
MYQIVDNYNMKNFIKDTKEFIRIDQQKIQPISDKKYVILLIQSIILVLLLFTIQLMVTLSIDSDKHILFLLALFFVFIEFILIKNWKIKLFNLKIFTFKQIHLITYMYLVIAFIDPILEKINENISCNKEITEQIFENYPLYINLFVSALVPAIVEEMMFRGFLLKGIFRNRYVSGLFITSVIFSLAHNPINLVEFIIYGYSGIILGWVYLKTDRLEASILLHFINNGIVVLLNI